MKSGIIIACAVLGLAILYHAPVFAEDELHLCGIVKNMDTKKVFVSVDVQSESCRGLRTFKLPAADRTSSFNLDESVNESICFYIDVNRCQPGTTYSITKFDNPQQETGGSVLRKESADKGRQSH